MCRAWNIAKDEPKREYVRRDIEDPRAKKSSTDRDALTRALPKWDSEEPNRA